MENLLDELIAYRWAVEVAAVDVIHAGRDCLAQNHHGRIMSRGSPQTPGPASCMAP
jgi:hypothetical protein